MAEFDIIIKDGLYFDGTGKTATIQNIGIKAGKITQVSSEPLNETHCSKVIAANNMWVMPGSIDTHTHYDAELIASPSLSESVRHGVTTVMVGSCSLSIICSEHEDASDIFTRVETVPREKVLPIIKQHKTWSTPKGWVDFVQNHPLGPNVISMLGHSDLRAGVMGLLRSTDAKVVPTEAEMQKMEALLKESLDIGFLGLSTMRLKWDKLDGDRAWSKSLPSTYARWKEVSRLNKLVRQYDRVHQGAPNAAAILQINRYMRECMGIFHKPLKTTLISRMDLKGSVYLSKITNIAARVTNFFKGDFRWQVLPTPFTVYADGIDVVFFEEFGAGEMALDLKDQISRNKLLKDEKYRRDFRKFYGEKLSPRVWQRDFGDAIILDCPDASIIGKNFSEVAKKREVHVVDLFLDLVVEFGTSLRWYTTVANHRKHILKNMVKDDKSLITFSDAGAHIRNMAFYNLPLRMLKLIKESADEGQPVMSMEKAVWKMTGDQADWFGIDAGRIQLGDRADVTIINPKHFDQNLEDVCWKEMDNFELQRLVNRNPDLVNTVLINGKLAFENNTLAPELGTDKGFGTFLPAK
ncbi:N-acyl-D-glutamate amidohydrolase [Shewanella sp. D64]|uniref:N-acyl-D-amino-acid deacylase family protein n=1 Tax=unclassified Shewanella TaxID=196818 RepID=UPI0022BA5380|nr:MULTISPECIES: N-acyl-D-glutamate amidohydrolase [unclassified Shewanella]MEC4727402.1 N-acyl-D-glutamate amidohydrolase [Shewanella sp. D64]MEC4739557.1 N-acyl-D-glutamate amidohydrolase [Shewanella sp. E94]WBJ96060.1 N-acyl-D-glutamate amidohydrolase [Shewanella sp. MTB7]